MATVIQKQSKSGGDLPKRQWLTLGLAAALGSVAAVLAVQAIALAIWPDLALFKPLESYARSALFHPDSGPGRHRRIRLAGDTQG